MENFDYKKYLKDNPLLKEYEGGGIPDSDVEHEDHEHDWEDTGDEEGMFTGEEECKVCGLRRSVYEEATLINPEDLPGDEEGYVTDDAGQRIKVREDRFDKIEYIFSGAPEPGTEQEAPAHITALAIAAEDAYEEMGNVDEVLKFVEMHLRGAYGDY